MPLATAVILASALLLQPAEPVVIEITFEVGAEEGAVMAVLFDSAPAYDGGDPFAARHVHAGGAHRLAAVIGRRAV